MIQNGTLTLVGGRTLSQVFGHPGTQEMLRNAFGHPVVGQALKKLTLKYRAAASGWGDVYSVTVDTRPMGFRYDGTQVTHVFPWGHAAKAGMTPGSNIIQINGQEVDDLTVTSLYQTAE